MPNPTGSLTTIERFNPILVDLALTDGKAFDALVPGEFIDMWGRDVIIEPEDLAIYERNTAEAIAATESESGEIVGLPIDTNDHNRGDAAGWIVGVELVGEILRFIPKWTDFGLQLIQDDLKRFFSATINLKGRTALGGTLTNWPAIRDSKGFVLLRPIELSSKQNLWQLDKDTFNAHSLAELIASTAFASPDNSPTDPPAADPPAPSSPLGSDPSPLEAEMTPEEIKELIANSIQNELAGAVDTAVRELIRKQSPNSPADPDGNDPDPDGDTPPATPVLSVLDLLDLSQLEEETVNEIKQAMLSQHEALRQRAAQEAAQMLSAVKRESITNELANLVTGGGEGMRFAFNLTADELAGRLLALKPDDAKWWGQLLENAAKNGLIKFTSSGHSQALDGTVELPKAIAAKLDSGELKIEDLASPVLALGDISKYDLSKWRQTA